MVEGFSSGSSFDTATTGLLSGCVAAAAGSSGTVRSKKGRISSSSVPSAIFFLR
jgi:hypothetical protein